MSDAPVVLFLCTHNAGRSFAARALLEHHREDASRRSQPDPNLGMGSTPRSSQSWPNEDLIRAWSPPRRSPMRWLWPPM